MPIITCHCGAKLRISEDQARRGIKCPKCEKTIRAATKRVETNAASVAPSSHDENAWLEKADDDPLGLNHAAAASVSPAGQQIPTGASNTHYQAGVANQTATKSNRTLIVIAMIALASFLFLGLIVGAGVIVVYFASPTTTSDKQNQNDEQQQGQVSKGQQAQANRQQQSQTFGQLRSDVDEQRREVESEPGVITNSIGMKLKLMPAGSFLMGTELESPDEDGIVQYSRPAHQVTLTKEFYLGVYEVTQLQYERVMGSNPSNFLSPQMPVDQLSWDDAVEFCRKLSELPEEKAAGRVYRLPTEAEWEYACRAGTTTEFSFGDDESRLDEYAWYSSNSSINNWGSRSASQFGEPVGQKKPNPWGLYDMHGGVWEWCSDYGSNNYASSEPVTDPTGPEGPSDIRVTRGGSRGIYASRCRSYIRKTCYQTRKDWHIGFRVALGPSGE